VTARQARLIAIPFMLLSFALRLADAFWLRPLAWRLDPVTGWFAVSFGTFIAAVLVPLGAYWLICRSALRRPSTWRVEEGRFVTHASAITTGRFGIVVGWIFAGLVDTERVAGTDRVRLSPLDGFTAVTLAVAVVLLLLTVLVLISDRPRLTLSADGFTLLTPIGGRSARWDELVPDHRGAPTGRRVAVIDAVRQTPSGARKVRLPTARLDIDPAFLAHTIRFYVDVPATRIRIGTDEGLRELQDARVPAVG
jgi:uncharacterized membrane protein YbhN (UPF0104 family)